MKPYPRETIQQAERIYNYRLSQSRRIIENCFGIAGARFRIFRKPIIGKVDTVFSITKAVVALHNCLMSNRNVATRRYCRSGYTVADIVSMFL